MAKRPPRTPDAGQPSRRLTELELRVWEAVTEQDARLPHASIDWDSVLETIDAKTVYEVETPVIHRPTYDQLEKLLGVKPNLKPLPPKQENGGGIDRNTSRRLRQGKFPIDATLDLHGHGQEEARRMLDGFITSSYDRQRRVVLVITGKGRLSKGGDAEGGVLRRALPKWLALPPCDRIVLSHIYARQEDGGEGAFYILIRRHRGLPNVRL